MLDAGDILQGTPYFNFFTGELEFKLMDYLQYDAATIGNHDFDAGIDRLAELTKNQTFSMINSNYLLDDTVLKDCVQSYKVIDKSGIKLEYLDLESNSKDWFLKN